jgi:VWFA-related protein
MSTRCVRWIPSFCLLASVGFGQQGPPPNHEITLDVVVTDKSGHPVSGLEQNDFTLLDEKQPTKILSFGAVQGNTASAPPLEVIVLVDEVNTNFTYTSIVRAQIEKFLRHDGGELQHPTSLAVLTDMGISVGNVSTKDGNALAEALDQNKAGLRSITRSQGVYGAGDRFSLSLNALQQLAAYETPRPGRKLVIWMSPGWPLLTGPRIQLSDKDEKGLFGNIVSLSDNLRRAGITIYSIDPLGTADAATTQTFYYREFVKGVKKPGQVQMANLALQVLATQTGGRVFNSNNDVAGEIASAIEDANAFYVLTFEGLVGDGPNEYHSLEIKLAKPGLTARTRTGYYAQPAR